MNKLYNFDFTSGGDYRSPKEIIEEQCKYLEEGSHNLVLGRVQDYSGNIQNYIRPGVKSPIKALSMIWEDQDDEEVDIQTQLGELSDGVFTYDFFITSKYTENYKYRVMFFRYGIGAYPVKLVIDENITKDLNMSSEKSCSNEKDFEEVLGLILNSNKFQEVARNLFSYNKKIEKENKDSFEF